MIRYTVAGVNEIGPPGMWIPEADYDALEAALAEAKLNTLAGCREVYDEKIGIQQARITALEAEKPWDDLGAKQVEVLGKRIAALAAELAETKAILAQSLSDHDHADTIHARNAALETALTQMEAALELQGLHNRMNAAVQIRMLLAQSETEGK